MLRTLGCCILLTVLPAPVRAQEPPEKLLSPTTQLFIKWDGVTAHKDAYKASALGSAMAGGGADPDHFGELGICQPAAILQQTQHLKVDTVEPVAHERISRNSA